MDEITIKNPELWARFQEDQKAFSAKFIKPKKESQPEKASRILKEINDLDASEATKFRLQRKFIVNNFDVINGNYILKPNAPLEFPEL